MRHSAKSFYDTAGLNANALDFVQAMVLIRIQCGDIIHAEDADVLDDLSGLKKYRKWSRLFQIIANRARRNGKYILPQVITNSTQAEMEL